MTSHAVSKVSSESEQHLQVLEQHRQLQRLVNLPDSTQRELDEDEIDLRQYWLILLRYKTLIFTVTGVALLLALIATSLMTPIYRSTLLLQIDQEPGQVLEYESVISEDSPFNSKDFYQTQYELLKSRTLARRVIDDLGLTFETPDAEKSFDLKSWLKESLGLQQNDDGDQAPDLEKLFLDNLEIEPLRNSRLVKIHYDSPVPEEAAVIVNSVADHYINSTLERRFEASSYAKNFLEERIQQVRANLEDSERRLLDYAREREILNLDDKLGILLDLLKEMNATLIQVEAERIAAESEYQQALEQGDSISSNILDSPVIQKLKEQRVILEIEYQEKLKTFKPEYPKMQQLQQQIAEVDRGINAEMQSIRAATTSNYQTKVREEAKLQARIAEIKSEILSLQDRSTDYQVLKREVDTNRQLYDGLLQRMKEVGVAAGVSINNISIVDSAEPPHRPYKPNLKLNIAIAGVLGLMLGVFVAFLLNFLDDTVKDGEAVERLVHSPTLGVIPDTSLMKGSVKTELALISHDDPKSPLAEAYRSLRTSLIFSTSEGAPKMLHFTSSGPGEGKTTSAVNTAIAFAQTTTNRVLLVDCDLRNPSIHKVFNLVNTPGLSNYLTGGAEPLAITKETHIKGLFTIPSGPLPPNPVELLSSARMIELLNLARERFDYIILDGPPVIGLADALVLSNLAQATTFIVAAGETRLGALENAIKRLRSSQGHVLGSVLTKFGQAGSGYGYNYDYRYSYHYYSYQADSPELTTEPNKQLPG